MIKNMQKSRFAKNIHDLSLLEKWAAVLLGLGIGTGVVPEPGHGNGSGGTSLSQFYSIFWAVSVYLLLCPMVIQENFIIP